MGKNLQLKIVKCFGPTWLFCLLQSFPAPCFYFVMVVECGAVQCSGAEMSPANQSLNVFPGPVLCFGRIMRTLKQHKLLSLHLISLNLFFTFSLCFSFCSFFSLVCCSKAAMALMTDINAASYLMHHYLLFRVYLFMRWSWNRITNLYMLWNCCSVLMQLQRNMKKKYNKEGSLQQTHIEIRHVTWCYFLFNNDDVSQNKTQISTKGTL